jgi:hypothetical protein
VFQAIMLSVAILFLGVLGLPAAMLYYGMQHPSPPQYGPSIQEKLAADWGDRCVANGNGEVGRTLPSGRDRTGTYVDFNVNGVHDAKFEKFERYRHLKIVDCPQV